MRWLVILQLAALLVLGALVVARFPTFAEVDERAHYSYVQEVAEERRLPVLGRDLISPEAQAVEDGTWPRPSPRDPRELGFEGQSYEAFQPPLYYLVTAPVFALVDDYRHKLYGLRAFDLLLLLCAVALLALLARAVFAGRWLLPFSLGLAVLLWPGVLVRMVTVSNSALELPLALAFLLAVWRATERRSAHATVAAGALLGLCLLTKLTLVFLAPLLLLPVARLVRGQRARPAAVLALVLPALMLAPWVASNLHRYDAPTANALAREQQEPVLNPRGEDYGVRDLPGRAAGLGDAVLPQEWREEYDRPLVAVPLRLMAVLLLLGALFSLVRRPDARKPAAAVLALPAALAGAMLALTLLAANWDIFLPRYLIPALPGLALLAGRGPARERTGFLVSAGSTAAVLALWAFLAGAYLFTDAGSRLGIEPASIP